MAEVGHRPGHHVVNIGVAGDVGGDGHGATSGSLDFGNSGGVLLGVAGGDGDVGAGVGQAQRHAQTQTTIAAGDQGHPPGEVKQVAVVGSHYRLMSGRTATKAGAKTSDTIAISLSRMFRLGPEVSLNGSPTTSPSTAAL